MVESWVVEETQSADFGDERCNARLQKVLSQLGGSPTASIPAACGGHADMTSAYRFFENDKVTFDRILSPHIEATRKRMAAQKTVILAQDTTEIDVTRPAHHVHGAGPLDGDMRRGLFLHPLHAFTPDGTPLGTLHALHWVRPEGSHTAALTRAERAAIPYEQKESFRWLDMQRRAQQETTRCPNTRLITVSDSEADIYELLVEPQSVDWIIRGCQNRALQSTVGQPVTQHLYEHLMAQPVLYVDSIHVRGRTPKLACDTRKRRQPRRTRTAQVEVRSAHVTLRPPWRPNGPLNPVTLNVVLVREIDPPAGDEPIEWLLLTSLPVEGADQVRAVVQFYCIRWMIEILFRVLKSGCHVEERRFETIARVEACLALYLVIAWRTLFVCRLGRAIPEICCEAVFEPEEWKAVWTVVQRSDLPTEPPSLGEMIGMVAELGGYVQRKHSPPGPQTIWIGLQRTHDFAICWKSFGPETRASS